MIDRGSVSGMAVVNAGRVGGSAVAGLDPMYPPPVWLSCGLEGRAEVPGQPFEVQYPSYQPRLLSHSIQFASTKPSETMKLFAFTKQLLDLFPTPLRQMICQPSLPHPYSRVKAAAPPSVCGDMRFNLALKTLLR